MHPIAILGAGIAGLTAAAELNRRGLPVTVFEAGPSVGGMMASFKDPAGFTYDFGAHFVNNRLAAALGAAKVCRPVKHYGEAVHVDGADYGYPFGLMRSPRFVRSALAGRLKHGRPVENAEDWFRDHYGDALAEKVAIPIAEAWSGTPARELAPAVGEKMANGTLKTLYLKAAARLTGRAVCIGYSHELRENAGIHHVYPEGGIAQLLEPTLNEVRHLVRLASPVEKILVEDGRVKGLRVGGETIEASAVVSTAPVNMLPKLIEGSNALDHLKRFRYRPMIFVNLHFEGRHHLPDTMLWVPGGKLPFFRLTETPISMPWLAPAGKTLITFDIGCEVGDALWSLSDAELAALCLDGISELYPLLRGKYLGAGGIMKTPISYPVYRLEYEAERQRFARASGIDGLYSIGRNGEFAHILMEDVYCRAVRRMADVAAYVARPQARDAAIEGLQDVHRMMAAETASAGSIEAA
ncbi:protoporphyrinogen/coproporphyrinogen oxidase [Jiella sonneratiae]|uniref:FAD-dependent oxidoreductase n=1 Tax=Jiella sonneratiae TaxID=2816856 RepID=A0ABS3J998_9HYPH|nr:FAD-dependent oxidoreductase [Jiella sonneratiae]MBO0905710.1 FAD-dependent oxidoreductase [Jiella sonneratiae]